MIALITSSFHIIEALFESDVSFSNASTIKASIVLWLIFGLTLNTIELICEQLLMT